MLVELTKVEGTAHGSLIAAQMLDVAVRVQSIRHLAVQQMALLVQVRACYGRRALHELILNCAERESPPPR